MADRTVGYRRQGPAVTSRRVPGALNHAERLGPPFDLGDRHRLHLRPARPRSRRSIESLGQQTVAPAETLLVIDYAPELEEECRRRWSDIRVIPNRAERGSCGGRNTGVAESTGEVVAFLDDDAIPTTSGSSGSAPTLPTRGVIGVAGGVNPRWLDKRPAWFPPEFDWVVGCMHSGMPKEREPVRNAIAANMAIRREEMLAVGGLRKEFSRIEKNAAGGEETDLCIRLTERWPERMILFDPAPAVEHCVPPERGELRYFITRCFAEGRSKAALARLVGSQSGLSSERSYVRRTLPLGVLRGLGDVLHGEFAGGRAGGDDHRRPGNDRGRLRDRVAPRRGGTGGSGDGRAAAVARAHGDAAEPAGPGRSRAPRQRSHPPRRCRRRRGRGALHRAGRTEAARGGARRSQDPRPARLAGQARLVRRTPASGARSAAPSPT